MKCQKCKREFSTPLERFDGKLFCPLCKSDCRIDIPLKVTEESDEQYRIGELLYLKSMVCTDSKRKSVYVEKARELVYAAAMSGHPKALLRLANMYFSGFMIAEKKIAVTLAENYFRNVWEGKYTDDLAEYVGLKQIAAAQHIEMLRLRGKSSSAKKLKEPMKNAGVDPGEIDSLTLEEEVNDPKQNLDDALKSCFIKSVRPICGVISIRCGELKQWAKSSIDIKVKGEDVSNIRYFATQKIFMQFYRVKTATFYALDLSSEIPKIESDDPSAELNKIDDGEELLVYFFNEGNCPKKYKAIEKLLDENNYENLIQLVNGICPDQRDIIIREDDILLFKSELESIRHAFGELITLISQKNYLKDKE